MPNNSRILSEIDTMAAMLDGFSAKLRSLRKEVMKGELPEKKKRRAGLSQEAISTIKADYWAGLAKKR